MAALDGVATSHSFDGSSFNLESSSSLTDSGLNTLGTVHIINCDIERSAGCGGEELIYFNGCLL